MPMVASSPWTRTHSCVSAYLRSSGCWVLGMEKTPYWRRWRLAVETGPEGPAGPQDPPTRVRRRTLLAGAFVEGQGDDFGGDGLAADLDGELGVRRGGVYGDVAEG